MGLWKAFVSVGPLKLTKWSRAVTVKSCVYPHLFVWFYLTPVTDENVTRLLGKNIFFSCVFVKKTNIICYMIEKKNMIVI